MSYTSIGTQHVGRLAPDLGVILAADMQSWPPELANHKAVDWIRRYRDRQAGPFYRTGRTSGPGRTASFYELQELASRALRSALFWRLDLCIKLLLHIGWQWTTADQLLNDTAEALTPGQLRVSAALARQQFQQREDERGAWPGASAPPSAVLRASDDQLEAALRSIYTDSRDFHARRLAQAQTWWPAWLNEASLLQWQAGLVDGHPRSHIPFGRDDGALYDMLIILDRLCQPPVLFATIERDGASREELLAPDPDSWSSGDAQPIIELLDALLNSPDMDRQHDTIVYWLEHSRLPKEVNPIAASPAGSPSPAPAPWFAASGAPSNVPKGGIGKGLVFEAVGQLEEAVASYNRAIALQPNNPIAWYRKATVLMRMERPQEVLAALDQAIQIHHIEDAQIWLLKGEVLDKLGRHAEARAAFERAHALEFAVTAAEAAAKRKVEAALADRALAMADREFAIPTWRAIRDEEVIAAEAAEAISAADEAAEATETAAAAEAAPAADEADQAADHPAAQSDTGYEP